MPRGIFTLTGWPCWWCDKPLAESFRETKDRDGNTVRVHRSCLEYAKEEAAEVTAQESEWPTSPALRG